MRVRTPLLYLLLAVGCGDDGSPAITPVAAPPVQVIDAAPAPVVTAFDGGPDEAAALAELGAIPAWTAVIDRHRYLARRGQRGAVHGRASATLDGTRWLIDESEGRGSLGIRLLLPAGAEVEPGQRLLVHGAWTVDAQHRWVWQAERAQRLAAADAPMAPFDPTRTLETAPAPDDAAIVSEAQGAAGTIRFQVIGAPLRSGSGWEIADPGATEVQAVLLLPGEHEPYGGQDLSSQDERWHLRSGVEYVVAIQRFRRRAGATPTLRAVAPPRIIE